ncbi:MAG: rRNA (pseudouridine1915-N3)-methyltransferase [Solirubrobacteraceae bacterium]|nr:rRNA (pseudouridine1915-N3)-methyltransferase [Solirubrobacteraceae bacterium]
MRVLILAVGRLRAPFADDVAHYEKLLSRYARVEVVEVDEEEKLARRVPERAHVVVCDERGRARRSEELSGWLEDRRQSGRDLVFVLGGPFGTGVEGDERLSFGPMTLPFQLARVVLLEQLYRAHKILAGEPYHH